MTAKQLTYEGLGFLIVALLWLIALLAESPWWILIAIIGSAIVLFALCRMAMKH